MMKAFLEVFFILLGSHVITSTQICPNDLSANCVCTSLSNKAFVSCSYPDPLNISKILSTSADQLQPSWIIQYFGIPNNNLTHLPDNYFDGFDMIFVVDMSGNRFNSMPEALRKLSKTTELNLSSNQFKSLNIQDYSVFKNLRKLDLSKNKIMDIVLRDPGVTMPVLRELNLSSNNVSSVESRALLSFPNLRNLILAKNRNFEAISSLDFPEHISAMSLESTGIKTIDVCIFKHLNDLEILNLDDNVLECTCNLFTLFNWVKVNRDDGLVHEAHGEESKCQCLENGMTKNISDFGDRNCNATSTSFGASLCAEITPEENLNVLSMSSISDFNINIESAESEHINLAWNAPNTTTLYGFVVVASLVDSEDEPFYTSTILHPNTLTHSVQGSDVKSGNFKICVKVLMYNATTVVKVDCETAYIFSSQIIVGILAGVVFIVPFMAILFCIIRLDQRNIKKDKYMQIQEAKDFETKKVPADFKGVSVDKPVVPSDEKKSTTKTTLSFQPNKHMSSPTGVKSGTDNPSFVNGDKFEVKVTGSSNDNTAREPQYGAISSHL